MSGYPLSDIQRAYVEVDRRREQCVAQGGEIAAVVALALTDVLAMMLEINANADAGLEPLPPDASY